MPFRTGVSADGRVVSTLRRWRCSRREFATFPVRSDTEYSKKTVTNVAGLKCYQRARLQTSMSNDRHPVTAELAAATSPYMRKNIRRFGKYGLDMEETLAPLFPKPLPFKMPL